MAWGHVECGGFFFLGWFQKKPLSLTWKALSRKLWPLEKHRNQSTLFSSLPLSPRWKDMDPLPFLICFTYIVFNLGGFRFLPHFGYSYFNQDVWLGGYQDMHFHSAPICTMSFISIIGHQLEEFYSSDGTLVNSN